MAKKYTGSLTLEWFNKQKSIVQLGEEGIKGEGDVPAPQVNWINKDDALFYETTDNGKGLKPYWVDRNDIRVKEARPLVFKGAYRAVEDNSSNPHSNTRIENILNEADAKDIENTLIKGDNLLALNSLKRIFDKLPEEQKVKCIYIDPPYNTGNAFVNYDDNLTTSTWLTMIRDRVQVLKDLLRSDGLIFVQLDEKNIFHLKVMMDDIFGKDNFVNLFTIKTSDPSGLKTVNPSPYDSAEYIIMYAKNKADYKYETIFVESEHDFGYNRYIKNIEAPYEEWDIVGVNEFIAQKNSFENTRKAKLDLGEDVFDSMVSKFAVENAHAIFQGTRINDDAGQDIVKLRNDSKKQPDKVVKLLRESGQEIYALNGRQIYFYSNKVKEVNGKKKPTKHLTNIWMDIPYNGISNEGNVIFTESKKPERLLKRIFQVANVKEGDLVLDSFAGSGTTMAAAHKMGFKWIGVELGNHAETHIIERMKGVISGNDNIGISEEVKWSGGGSFKYYHLGESIINIDSETGKGEFNWNLEQSFIQESLLISYDFAVNGSISLDESLLANKNSNLSLGKFLGNTGHTLYGVADIASPEDENLTISNEDIKSIYNKLKSNSDFKSLTIFTNKGIDLAEDSIPSDLEIVKVPHAIFANLER